MGLRIIKISKKHFFEKKPHKRPFFYPGSMSPKLARCMVNLTRIKSNDRLLDPFCGTGGILIEAGIIGARVVGSDIDPKMVKGTIENLKHCEINDYEIFEADARKLKLAYQVDGIATDPPYGISASTRGSDSSELYEEALYSFEHLIKDEGLMCLATPHTMDIQNILEGTKFEIIEQYHIRMHKSLTRVISVLKKIKLKKNFKEGINCGC
jgi:tRNA (guanine10-N2)-dimethyltransferase